MHGNSDQNSSIQSRDDQIAHLKIFVSLVRITIQQKAESIVWCKLNVYLIEVVTISCVFGAVEVDSKSVGSGEADRGEGCLVGSHANKGVGRVQNKSRVLQIKAASIGLVDDVQIPVLAIQDLVVDCIIVFLVQNARSHDDGILLVAQNDWVGDCDVWAALLLART